MSTTIPAPEVGVVRRSLQFFWLADYSGSMSGRKIATLNQAIREAIPEVRKAVAAYPEVQILMRAIKFSDQADWHVGPDAVDLESFVWPELSTNGSTATAQAVRMLAAELSMERIGRSSYPPVCILVSDGYCTDPDDEYQTAIAELDQQPWGRKAVRLAIAVGDESDYDEAELARFVNQPDVGVLKADTPEKLSFYIKWYSVKASVGASAGRSSTEATTNVVIEKHPEEPQTSSASDALDVF